MSKESCGICTDVYTSTLRKKCICKYCNTATCSKCIERYLLDRHEDAHCLHCRVNYNDTALHEMCTKTYLKHTYFKHRQEVLINRERANLPGLQDIAMTELKKRENERKIMEIKAEIIPIEKERDIVLSEYNKVYKNKGSVILNELIAKMDEYRILIDNKRKEIQDIVYLMYNKEEEKEEKRKFIRRCTRDNCQGFLSTAWKCGICEYYSCSKCFKPKTKKQYDLHNDPHECLKDDLDTAELIKKDCKPCPNCGEFIMKSSGCFAKNTIIPTWTSYKMSQDIVVGDELIGDDCLKRIVLETCSGIDTLYEVTQHNAMNYTVNSKHILVLKYKNERIPYLKNGKLMVEWFDRKELVHKRHHIQEPYTLEPIPIDIEIMVEDYMKLDDYTKQQLYGFTFQDSYMSDDSTSLHSIEVKEIGLGEYYGWKVDSNNRFILSDDTVLHNCDQMWCLSCKTPWSWTSGKVVTSGPIHNPHYYEWMRRNGSAPRNPADVPCGGYPGAWELRRFPINVNNSNLFYEFHRICGEIQEISERNYRSHIDNNTTAINVKFLLGDFDEKRWGQHLGKNERKRKRDSEVQEIFAAFRMVAVELINRVQTYDGRLSKISVKKIEEFLETLYVEIHSLINMINDGLKTISISYSYSVPYIYNNNNRYSIRTNNFSHTKVSCSSDTSENIAYESDVQKEIENIAYESDVDIQKAIEESLSI